MGGEGERERKPFGGRGGRGGRDGERGGDRGDYRRRDAGGEGKEGAPSGEFAPQLYVYIQSVARELTLTLLQPWIRSWCWSWRSRWPTSCFLSSPYVFVFCYARLLRHRQKHHMDYLNGWADQ